MGHSGPLFSFLGLTGILRTTAASFVVYVAEDVMGHLYIAADFVCDEPPLVGSLPKKDLLWPTVPHRWGTVGHGSGYNGPPVKNTD